MRKLAQEIEVLEKQFTQRQQELAEFKASEKKLTETLQLLGARSLAHAQALRTASRAGDRDAAARAAGHAKCAASLRSSRLRWGSPRRRCRKPSAKIDNARTTFRAQAEDDLAKSRGDLAVLDENIKAAQDKVRRTELRSPVNGIVNKLNVTTVGAVVSPGGNVMEIVPAR